MIRVACTAVLIASFVALPSRAELPEDNWPTWRGPKADGVAIKGTPPISFSESKNLRWKVAIEGESSSTPVIWGDKLFIQSAEPTGEPAVVPEDDGGRGRPRNVPVPEDPYRYYVNCIDKNTGELIWKELAVQATPHEGHHSTGSFAPFSPVTDGEKLWASFGSQGIYCYDLDGTLLWKQDLIEMRTRNGFGEGSSPGIVGDVICVLMDHEGDSKIFAFNKNNGDLLWSKPRDAITNWSSPLGLVHDGKEQFIVAATEHIQCYDANTGEIVWETDGLTTNVIPTPVTDGEYVYCTSGFRGFSLKAIELGNSGNLNGTDAIAWEVTRGTPYVASPLLYEDRIYVLSNLRPALSCFNANTGEALYSEERLSGLSNVYASPVGANGKVYIADREGNIAVIEHGDEFKILETIEMDEGFDASPVIVGDAIYLKGHQHLYCIAED